MQTKQYSPLGNHSSFIIGECKCRAWCVYVFVEVLEVLWELAHLPTLPTSLVQQALEEHLGILSDAYAVKETVKRSYIIKCIEDIKKVRQTRHSLVGHSCCCLYLVYTQIHTGRGEEVKGTPLDPNTSVTV